MIKIWRSWDGPYIGNLYIDIYWDGPLFCAVYRHNSVSIQFRWVGGEASSISITRYPRDKPHTSTHTTNSFPGCYYIGFPNANTLFFNPLWSPHKQWLNVFGSLSILTLCVFVESSWKYQLLSTGTLGAHNLLQWKSLAHGENLLCCRSNYFQPPNRITRNWITHVVSTTFAYLRTHSKTCISFYPQISRIIRYWWVPG